ncbi:MAG TPA: circadian clock KaiB family protein [Vicinamibacterales bacterium]|nr:circadian clock KaiB family protein [Vicinamibacterales bacterium]
MELVTHEVESSEQQAFPLCAERRRTSMRSPRSSAPRGPLPKQHDADNRPEVELVLYVSAISPHSTTALRNLRRALASFASHRIRLTVHDLSKDPQRAERDGVHFTPALVTTGHRPRTWIVGHLGNPQVLQALLESALEPTE